MKTYNIKSFRPILCRTAAAVGLIIALQVSACGKLASSFDEELSSPERAVALWYKAWQTSDQELLKRVFFDPPEGEVHFGGYDLEQYEIVSKVSLGKGFDQREHLGAETGDVAIETREFFHDPQYPPLRKYLLLRSDSAGNWRVVEYSVIYDENCPAPPED